MDKWTNTFKGIKISLWVIKKLHFQNIFFFLMPLNENSPFSVLVLLRKDILPFLQGSFGFQWLKEQEKGMGRITKRRNPGRDISALAIKAAPASTVLIHVSDHILPPALSLGWQVSLSAQFYCHLLIGQATPPCTPIKASTWVFKAKG